MHFYAWQKGLKTGMYYLRSKAATDPIKFTVKQSAQKKKVAVPADDGMEESPNIEAREGQAPESDFNGQACNLDDPDCLMCGA